ncbi:MAG: alpha/beta hydrolase [Rhodobiaceae bacterium]|nr:alpha/beta hydrolase [Rhodobiaceae bacterium]MCC0055034.1 alpha/beta hydrolase [Rhodobiaceae bacterium]
MTASTMPQPRALKTFRSQRLTLSYAEWGDPEAPLLFLVHGGRDQKRSWDWIAPRLAKRYRVIAHDLRGHGWSDRVSDGAYTVMDNVLDFAALMDELEADKPVIIGHSLGGNITIRYCGLFPDRVERLVAIEGLGRSPTQIAERERRPLEARLQEWVGQRRRATHRAARVMKDVAEAMERMRAAHPQLSEEHLAHLTGTGVRHNPDGTVSWLYDPAFVPMPPFDLTDAEIHRIWGCITCPVWHVYGEKSWATDPREDGRAAHFRNAQVTMVEDAGHWLHHDRLEVFMGGLENFLNTSLTAG